MSVTQLFNLPVKTPRPSERIGNLAWLALLQNGQLPYTANERQRKICQLSRIDYEPQFNELQTDVPVTIQQQRYDFLRHNNYGYAQGVVGRSRRS